MKKINGIGFFEKNLTFWVLICMAIGIFIGKYFPSIPDRLGKFEFYKPTVSIPTTNFTLDNDLSNDVEN